MSEPNTADKLILTKIDGRFVFVGIPRTSPLEPHFYIRAGDQEFGPMTFLQCKVRLPDYLDGESNCDLVERTCLPPPSVACRGTGECRKASPSLAPRDGTEVL